LLAGVNFLYPRQMPPQSQLPRVVRFGTFEVEVPAGELRKNGLKLKLQEQPFQVLCMLLEHPGEVVTREDLRSRLWPGDTFGDFDHGLNGAIKRLRDTLGDSSENPRFVETLARRGYRFIAPVDKVAEPKTGLRSLLARATHVSRLPYVLVPAGAAVAIIALIAAFNWAGNYRSSIGAGGLTIKSLAVLPLKNFSSDPEEEYFADAMTDQLIAELSRINSLKIISRTSVMQYKGEERKSLPQIARELGVDGIIEGSVLRSGNRVRIAANMIYAPTDQSLMAETHEGDLSDVLKIQREVAESITAKIGVKLTPEQQYRFREAPKVNPEAYQAYLAATHVDTSGYQGIKRAQSYLEKAIEKDPNFVSAYNSMAMSYVLLAANRWQSPGEAFPTAKQAIHKAMELDEKNCDAHAVFARISWEYDWDWQTAEKMYLNGLELCPNDSGLHFEYAVYKAVNGRIAEARAEMAKTRELDPIRSEPLDGEAVINYHLRDYKALIEIDRAFVVQDSNNWLAHYWLGVGYEGSGQMLQAIPEYQKAVDLSQGDSDTIAALAHAYAATSKRAEAQKILHEWLRQSETSYVSPYMIATVYAGLGGKDKAFDYLEKAYEERSADLPYFLRADLRMDNLRSDPRFKDLMHRMSFPQ
jgi:TolB-like protein/DNA-binding winged helix-turn-helix (wHTH) protein/Tfp pilus assembly protein PilF